MANKFGKIQLTVVGQNSAVSELVKLKSEFFCQALCFGNFSLGAESLVKSAPKPLIKQKEAVKLSDEIQFALIVI